MVPLGPRVLKAVKEMRAILACKEEWVTRDQQEHREIVALLVEMESMVQLVFRVPKV